MSKHSKRRQAATARANADNSGVAVAEALSTLATSLANRREAAESFTAGDVEFVDRRDYLPNGFGFDTLGFGVNVLSTQDDRRDGRNAPFVEDELDTDAVRGLARLVTTINCPGVGIVENLKNYIVGKGFQFKATRKKRRTPPKGLMSAVQDVIDEYLDDNDFQGDFDRELLLRSRRDGEYFLAHYPRPGGKTALRVAEPECVRDPAGAISEEQVRLRGVNPRCATSFDFGILTPQHDVNEPLGYAVCWRQEEGYDFLPAKYVVHHKLNVDRNVKRGLSDFYPAWRWLRQQERLLRNTGEGAAELAAIAYIVQFATASQQQVQSMAEGQADLSMIKRTPSGQQYVVNKHVRDAGTRLNVPKGQEYLPGPMGHERGQAFLEVVGGILRQIGSRWCMTEGMVSGDDSNNNMASMTEAGSRFYNFVDASQFTIGRQYYKSLWIALRIAYDCGRFARFGLTWEEFCYLVDIRVTPPAINKTASYEEEQVRQIRKQEGVYTLDKWKEEVGVDSDEFDDELDADSLDAATTAAGDVLDVAKQALNGAQVASLLQLLTSGAMQKLPLASIKAMVLASFPMLTGDQINAMVDPLEEFIPAAEGAPITAPPSEGGAQPDAGGGGVIAGIDYSDKSRLQFKRNASSILDVVKRLQAGELTSVQAGELLGMLGLPPDRAERLISDATDNGKLDDPELAKLAESMADELSPWWALQCGASVWERYP